MKPHVPVALPQNSRDVGRLIGQVGTSNAAIARYDGLLPAVVNPAVMLSPLARREGVPSTRLDRIQATVDEVLKFEASLEFDPEKTNDINEVVNYRKTLPLAPTSPSDRPIVRTPDIIERSRIVQPTAEQAIKKLEEAGILKMFREPSGRRPAVLAFPELVNQAEGRKVL